MYTQKDVAEYYNTTFAHYKQWWNLENNLSLHYGIWENGINNFNESLLNTNKTLAKIANIEHEERILDAGCGVGGAAIFLAKEMNAAVTGISLSKKQIDFATKNALKKEVAHKAHFMLMDYTKTDFEDETFDVVWACESVSSAPNKALFIEEAFRVLKKGGRLILCDFFTSSKQQKDPHQWMKKWGDTWSISEFVTKDFFIEHLQKTGFSTIQHFDYTQQIEKSAKRMYYTALLGAIPSEIYNLTHPKVSRFAKTHYKCGYFQYKALKENLWQYQIILAFK